MESEQEHVQTSDNKKKDAEKYKSALDLLFYEGQIAWQMNLLFIGLNVGIGTIIGGSLLKLNSDYILVGIASFIGSLINIAWLGTFRRNNKYYHFRMAQAREAEPKNWQLLRKRGYNFSKGQEVIINNKGVESNDKSHRLTSFERRASNKLAIELAIWIFIFCFIILLTSSCYYFYLSICK